MKLALQLASFGVLVFATVHTNSAPATIDRIINAFPADEQPQVRGMLAESLVGIVAQQLLKTADGKGRVAALRDPDRLERASPSMIREGKTFQIPSLMQAGPGAGHADAWTWRSSVWCNAKKITAEAALEKASDKESFKRKLGGGA